MNLREQRPDPVQRPRGLVGEVLVEAGEHLQSGEDVAVAVDLSEGVGHGAGRVSDDERVPRVGL